MGTGYHGGFGDSKGNNEQDNITTEEKSEDSPIFQKASIDSNYQALSQLYPLTKEGNFGKYSENCRIIESDDPIKTSIDFFERLGAGGNVTPLANGHGTKSVLDDGTIITHRLKTTISGSPAVDINTNNTNHPTRIKYQKIHFIKENKK